MFCQVFARDRLVVADTGKKIGRFEVCGVMMQRNYSLQQAANLVLNDSEKLRL